MCTMTWLECLPAKVKRAASSTRRICSADNETTCRSKWLTRGNIFFNAPSILISSSAKIFELKRTKAQMKLKKRWPGLKSQGDRRNKPIIISRFKGFIFGMIELIFEFDHERIQWAIIEPDRIAVFLIITASDRIAVIADLRPIISSHQRERGTIEASA